MRLIPFFIILLISPLYATTPDVIYGEDDRHEISPEWCLQYERFNRSPFSTISLTPWQETRCKAYDLATGVAAIIPKEALVSKGGKRWTPAPEVQTIESFFESEYEAPLCKSSDRFKKLALSDCTAFLIAPDRLLTARHCIFDQELFCKDNWIAFDYQSDSFGRHQLRECSKVEVIDSSSDDEYRENGPEDLALITLARPLSGRHIFELENKSLIEKNSESVLAIGAPNGGPMLFGPGKKIGEKKDWGLYFSIDAFAGNSGGPLISKSSHKVVAMVLSGKKDVFVNKERECLEINTCSEDGKKCTRPKDKRCLGDRCKEIPGVPGEVGLKADRLKSFLLKLSVQ